MHGKNRPIIVSYVKSFMHNVSVEILSKDFHNFQDFYDPL